MLALIGQSKEKESPTISNAPKPGVKEHCSLSKEYKYLTSDGEQGKDFCFLAFLKPRSFQVLL